MYVPFQKKIKEVKWLQQTLFNRGVSTEGKINSLHLVWMTDFLKLDCSYLLQAVVNLKLKY